MEEFKGSAPDQDEERKLDFSISIPGGESNVAGVDLKPPNDQGMKVSGPARRSSKGKWTIEEDEMLHDAVKKYNKKSWKKIAACLPNRTDAQCLHRWDKVLNPDVLKGPWSIEEDNRIIELAGKQGIQKWSEIAKQIPGRIGKQCRERWLNHLKPNITKVPWTIEEEVILINAHASHGNRWAEIAKMLPGRSENSVKNHWNCSLKKKLENCKATRPAYDSSISALPGLTSDKSEIGAVHGEVQQMVGVTCISEERRVDVRHNMQLCCMDMIVGYPADKAGTTPKNAVSEAIHSCAPKDTSSTYLPQFSSPQLDVRRESLSMSIRSAICTEEPSTSDSCASLNSRLRRAAMTYENTPSIIRKRPRCFSAPNKVKVSLSPMDIDNYNSLCGPELPSPPKYQKSEKSEAINSVGKSLEQEFKDA